MVVSETNSEREPNNRFLPVADKSETGAGTGTNKETGLKPDSGEDTTKNGTTGQTNNNTEASNKDKPESGEDTTNTGTKKQEPTYMRPEFAKEEERPTERLPMRTVVYSQLDPKATRCQTGEQHTWNDDDEDDLEELPGVSTSV